MIQPKVDIHEILQHVLDNMENRVFFQELTDNGDGTYTVESCNTMWLMNGDIITWDGNEYNVSEIIPNVSFLVTGDAAFEPVSYIEINRPKYFHGTIKKTNNELQEITMGRDKFPMIYCFEVFRETYHQLKSDRRERTSDLRLFFLATADKENWLTEDHYNEVIIPIRNMVESFIQFVNNKNGFSKLQNFETVNRVDFGTFSQDNGNLKLLFTEHVSGIELDISLEVNKDLTCSLSCPCPEPTPPACPVATYKNSDGSFVIQIDSSTTYTSDDIDITLNGSPFLNIPSNLDQDIELVNQDDDPITPDSVVGNKITINIPEEMILNFSVDNDNPLVGEEINFTPSYTGATPTQWLWDFGDGNISTLENPSHTYDTDGSYDVSLMAANVNSEGDIEIKESFITVNVAQNYAIQSYDSQYDLKINNTTLGNFDTNEAYSVGGVFRWDNSTLQNALDAVILVGNYDGSKGYVIGPRVSSGDFRMFVSDGSNFDIVTFPFAPVLDQSYCWMITHDGSRNYKLFINYSEQTPNSNTTNVVGSTLSTSPTYIGTRSGGPSNARFRGLQDQLIFCDKALSLSEYREFYKLAKSLDVYNDLSYSANVEGYFKANDGDSTGFESQVNASDKIETPNSRDYFKLPYSIYNWNPNPTINATNYVNNPIVDGTSLSSIEAYAGDVCVADDGDIVAVVKASDSPVTHTNFFVFKGADFDNLVEINSNSFPFPNWPVQEIGTVRIRREGSTYYLIVRRQTSGGAGGSGVRDICILETTDLTTDPSTWTQYLGLIDATDIPFEATGTGDWDLISVSDLFKYDGKYYMTCYCGNTLDYIVMFESNSITSGWTYKKTIFDVNQQDWLNTLSPSVTSANVVQGGSIIKDPVDGHYYCCVTLGMENSDNKNERYLILGRGDTPFEFEFYKSVLHQSGADGTYSERRVYDGQFIKKSDGNWLEPELIDSKYWLSYSGHSYLGNRPQVWDSNGKLSLMSWTPGNLIS